MSIEGRGMQRTFVPDPGNQRLLRDAFGRFATGVTVVTTGTEEGPLGITANSFSSVSLDPPLVMWAPGRSSRRFRVFSVAEHYAIHVLGAEQRELCYAFAKDGRMIESIAHDVNRHGVPLIPGCLARFECTRVATYEGGDHVLVLGKVERFEMGEGEALAFYAGKMTRIPAGE